MGIGNLRKNGWLNGKSDDVDLSNLEKDQLQQIKSGKQVVVQRGDQTYLIYIREGANLENIEQTDIVIRRIPTAARTPEVSS